MKDNNGNVVVGFTSDSILMLDCDLKRESEVVQFASEYAKFHDLGSSLVMLSSKNGQMDLCGEPLANYFVVFGKTLNWDQIRWLVEEAYRLKIVNKSFLALREFGYITLRLTAKNDSIPFPKLVTYFDNGDDRGVMSFLRFWVNCRKLGKNE